VAYRVSWWLPAERRLYPLSPYAQSELEWVPYDLSGFLLEPADGFVWIFALAIYGIAAHQLGRLGDSADWAIYQITMVLTACAAGVFSSEWRQPSRRSIGTFTGCIVTLAEAIMMVSSSSR
jgi:L-rhamnose-H+ transport protein